MVGKRNVGVPVDKAEWVNEMIKRENEAKDREKARKAAVMSLFKDQEEQEAFGFSEQVMKYMRKEV